MASKFSISKDSNEGENNIIGVFATSFGKKFSVDYGTTLKIVVGSKVSTRDTGAEITDIEVYGSIVKVITKGASKSFGTWLFENVDAQIQDVIVSLLLDNMNIWRVFYNGEIPKNAYSEAITLSCILKTTDGIETGWKDTNVYQNYKEALRNNTEIQKIHDKYESLGSLIVAHFDYKRNLDGVCIVTANGADMKILGIKMTGTTSNAVGSATIGLLMHICRNSGYKQITFNSNEVDPVYLPKVLHDDEIDSSIKHIPTEGAGTIKRALFYDVSSPKVIRPLEFTELYEVNKDFKEDIFPIDWTEGPGFVDPGKIISVPRSHTIFPKPDGSYYSFPLNYESQMEGSMGLPVGTTIMAAAHDKSRVLLAIIKLKNRDGLRLTAAFEGQPNFDPQKLLPLPEAQRAIIAAAGKTVAFILDKELFFVDLEQFHTYESKVFLARTDIANQNVDFGSKYNILGIMEERKIWIRTKGGKIIYYDVKQTYETGGVWMPNFWGPTKSNMHYY